MSFLIETLPHSQIGGTKAGMFTRISGSSGSGEIRSKRADPPVKFPDDPEISVRVFRMNRVPMPLQKWIRPKKRRQYYSFPVPTQYILYQL